MAQITAVVFDLGGVLLDFGGLESIARLSNGRVGPEEFNRFWGSPWADAVYKGTCSVEEFAEGAIEYFGLDVTAPVFLAEFRTWLRGPYEGAFELVDAVRRHATVACLSNTNRLDVERFRAELRLHDRFDHCFFSNEIGRRKPSAECYAYVLDRLGSRPRAHRVAFFDDSPDCVRGAAEAGMRAFETVGIDAVRTQLRDMGLLQDWSPSGR